MLSNDVQQRKRKDTQNTAKAIVHSLYNIEKTDTVNHPSHYNYGDIEVIDFIEQVTQHYNTNVVSLGNAIKYLARSPHKNGGKRYGKANGCIEVNMINGM